MEDSTGSAMAEIKTAPRAKLQFAIEKSNPRFADGAISVRTVKPTGIKPPIATPNAKRRTIMDSTLSARAVELAVAKATSAEYLIAGMRPLRSPK